MILGTAGHIDHGKTTLVRALTGVDADRLPEEKRRGITIDLGFAPLSCPGGGTIGVVDVPGHEAFVRTMLAGATGIDLALLVVAADEGAMPQTREHLAILSLLGVRGGVVALSKSDAVDAEWLELVADEVRALLAGTPIANAPIIATSGRTGQGIDTLRAAICNAATSVPARDADDLFRLPVDRSFTMRGTGTVVTGTVWSGRIEADAVVRILPGNRSARVRGIQIHGAPVGAAGPGTRAAISLHGVGVEDVARGSVLVVDPAWRETRVLRAEVALIEGRCVALGPRTRVRFHLGTHDVGARVVAAGGRLTAGDSRGVRIVLDAPVVARAGDRFVLRGGPLLTTIGGGLVMDPLPEGRRVRPWSTDALSAAERLTTMLEEAGPGGVDPSSLPVRLGLPPRAARALLERRAPTHVQGGGRLYFAALVVSLMERAAAMVAAHHDRYPLDPGAPLQSVRSGLGVPAELGDLVLQRAVDTGQLQSGGGTIAVPGWRPTLSADQVRLATRLGEVLEAAGWEPPSVAELEAAHGAGVHPVLRKLEREGRVVRIEDERYCAADAVARLESVLRGGMQPGVAYGPAELREVLGVSRKYLIPLLEYCDKVGVTDRRSGGRVVRHATGT